MSRFSALLSFGITGFVAVSLIVAGIIALNHVPRFYRDLIQNKPADQEKNAQEFVTEFGELINAIASGDKEWFARFNQNQINSYLAEGLAQLGIENQEWNEKLKLLRIAFQGDRLLIGFRHRVGPVTSVIHMEAQLWLAKGEPNTLAIKLCGAYAGAVPFNPQSVLERISENAIQNGIDVAWFRHQGKPVAIIRFQADRPRPTFLLRSLVIDKDILVIRGSSVDDENGLSADTLTSVPVGR